MKKNIFNNRRFKHGSLATVMTIGLVVLVILVNVIASMIADRLPVNIDLTDNKLYELSDESISFLETLETPIEIELFSTEEDFINLGNTYGFSNFAAPALELLKKYDRFENITVEYHDPYTNPDVISKYSEGKLGLGSIVVSCDGRHRILTLSDLFSVDMQTGYVDKSNVENAITSSIILVSNANPTKVTLLTGITGSDVSGLTDLLGNNGYELTKTDILTGTISDDTEILILAAPKSDLPAESLKKIDEYLDTAGEYNRNFYYFADPEQPELPNIEAFLAEWGIKIGDGIIFESDANKVYNQNYFFIEQDIANSLYADKLGNTNGYLYFVQYRPLEQLFEEDASRSTKVVISSYPSGILMPFNANENWKFDADDRKSYPAILLGQRTVSDANTNSKTTSSVVAFGSPTVADSTFLTQALFKNAEFLTVMSNELCGKMNSNIVAPKTAGIKTLGISLADRNVIVTIFQYVLPVIIIIAGMIVFIRRRNR